MHGYGICRCPDGNENYGQWKQNKQDGYGYHKGSNGVDYNGQWKNGLRDGDGVLIANG